MTRTERAEFQLPESSRSHAGDTKLCILPCLFSYSYFPCYVELQQDDALLPRTGNAIPSLCASLVCSSLHSFVPSQFLPPWTLGTVRLDSLLPSNVSTSSNKTLTPLKCYAQNLAWRGGFCSSKFTTLFSSSKTSSEFSWREAAPASKAFRFL